MIKQVNNRAKQYSVSKTGTSATAHSTLTKQNIRVCDEVSETLFWVSNHCKQFQTISQIYKLSLNIKIIARVISIKLT